MVDAAGAQRLPQRVCDVFLTLDLREGPGSVLAVKRKAHATIPPARGFPTKEPLAHPPEPAYPCCLPALGRFTG
ncbi:hypothetical protein GCM10023096_46930 [Nonomuraea ferruginea]